MKREWIIVLVLALVVISVFSVGLTGLSVLFALGDQGGKVNYAIPDVKNFVQCFDADPQNSQKVKSVCHAQYYTTDTSVLLGMNAVDYCRSKDEVVDYGCAKDLSCQEIVSKCDRGLVCDDGKCVKEKSFLKLPKLRFNL